MEGSVSSRWKIASFATSSDIPSLAADQAIAADGAALTSCRIEKADSAAPPLLNASIVGPTKSSGPPVHTPKTSNRIAAS
jgi:hypothetical protein